MAAYPIVQVFDRTTGHCHICFQKLSFSNYAQIGRRGAWEVEHSNPKATGGTDSLRNLYAACITCNRSKGAGSTRAARRRYGKTKAPLSAANRPIVKLRNGVLGGAAGAAVGGALFGTKGSLAGAVVGSLIAYHQNPDSGAVVTSALAIAGAGCLWWLMKSNSHSCSVVTHSNLA